MVDSQALNAPAADPSYGSGIGDCATKATHAALLLGDLVVFSVRLIRRASHSWNATWTGRHCA